MAKSDRLLQLMQCLRTLPAPVKAAALSQELGVSPRTIYRDIDALLLDQTGHLSVKLLPVVPEPILRIGRIARPALDSAALFE